MFPELPTKVDKVILCSKSPLAFQEEKVELLLQDFLDELLPHLRSSALSMRRMGSRGMGEGGGGWDLRGQAGEGRWGRQRWGHFVAVVLSQAVPAVRRVGADVRGAQLRARREGANLGQSSIPDGIPRGAFA